jgi:hypothetical protein
MRPDDSITWFLDEAYRLMVSGDYERASYNAFSVALCLGADFGPRPWPRPGRAPGELAAARRHLVHRRRH